MNSKKPRIELERERKSIERRLFGILKYSKMRCGNETENVLCCAAVKSEIWPNETESLRKGSQDGFKFNFAPSLTAKTFQPCDVNGSLMPLSDEECVSHPQKRN